MCNNKTFLPAGNPNFSAQLCFFGVGLGVNVDFPLSKIERLLAKSFEGDTKKIINKTIPAIDVIRLTNWE
jgi:hypothetical protein